MPVSRNWNTFEVPFRNVVAPQGVANEGGPSGTIDPRALTSLSFVIRAMNEEGNGAGESLHLYEIHLDNIEFY